MKTYGKWALAITAVFLPVIFIIWSLTTPTFCRWVAQRNFQRDIRADGRYDRTNAGLIELEDWSAALSDPNSIIILGAQSEDWEANNEYIMWQPSRDYDDDVQFVLDHNEASRTLDETTFFYEHEMQGTYDLMFCLGNSGEVTFSFQGDKLEIEGMENCDEVAKKFFEHFIKPMVDAYIAERLVAPPILLWKGKEK